MNTDVPTFDRREVDHSDFRPVTSERFINRRLAKRRCELERDMNSRLRERKQQRGLLRSHSIFLERKSKLCFFGYHFTDSVKADMPHLTEQDAEELSEYLFRLKYVVPVMKFVTEMSPTTVFYRYAEDERRLAPSLQRERVSCSEVARHLMDRTPGPLVTGNKLLELIDTHEADCSVDLVNNQQFVTNSLNRHTMLCQQMLHHGNLIPESSETPEHFQKFRPENNYYLCDSEEGRDRVRQLQQDKTMKEGERTRLISENAKALGSIFEDCALRRSFRGLRRKSNESCSSSQASTLNRAIKPRQHTLRRSSSLRTRKKSKAVVYWTMEVEQENRPITIKDENTEIQVTDTSATTLNIETKEVRRRRLSSRIMASDVEVIDKAEDILASETYAPPKRKTSFPDKLKIICKKLVGVNHNIKKTCNGNLNNISSIDAEWIGY